MHIINQIKSNQYNTYFNSMCKEAEKYEKGGWLTGSVCAVGNSLPINDKHPLFLSELSRVSLPIFPSRLALTFEGGERLVKPLVEGVHAIEDRGKQKVEQGPQLWEIVLQRSA
jgi:hypothetical protein